MSIMRTKSIEQSIRDTEEPEHRLRKDLGPLDLIVFGVGVMVGAGIFILTGQQAGASAGPAVAVSFLVAGVACALAALCYAEFASTVPVAGSAYTFSYASFGELVAWIIGWDLILEFTVAGAALAVSFSGYLSSLLDGTPFELPAALQTVSTTANPDGVVNLPAVLVSLVVMGILVSGIKISSLFNQIVVAIKLTVIAIVIVGGIGYVTADNYTPFVPPSAGSAGTTGGWLDVPLIQTLMGVEPSVFGWAGIFSAAAIVFFAFIGFDIVATTAEEARNPQRDIPIGIIGSLAIVTVLYMAVSLIITGLQDYRDISPNDPAPVATGFESVGLDWMSDVISVGVCIGLTVVVMILMLGQTRVGFAMARDRLWPEALAKVHPRFGTPYRITLMTGVAVAGLSGFVGLSTLIEMVSIGTLFAFALVSVGVVVLRRTRPDLPRAFRVRGAPVVAALAVVTCAYLMLNLVGETWVRFVVWMAIGLVIYFGYGRRHSRLAQREHEPSVTREDRLAPR